MTDNEAVLAQIEGLSCDSRKVQAGWLFAALHGEAANGADYIEQALAKGARAVLLEHGSAQKPAQLSGQLSSEVLWLECLDPRKRYAELAAAWWRKVPETLVGVTGTNGKTSSVFFLQQLWHAAGAEGASLGTLGVGRKNNIDEKKQENDTALTTAEPMALHALLAGLAEEGVSHCALEASSHGLAQRRLDGLRFQACVLTGFSRDHLDYHKSWEAYGAAKARLFHELLAEGGWIILPHYDSPADSSADSFAQQLERDLNKKAKVMRTHVIGEGVIGEGEPSDTLDDTLLDDTLLDDTLQAFGVVRREGRTEFSLRLRCENFCGDREILLEGLEASFEESFQLHNLLGALAAFFVTDKGGAWNIAWLRETVRGLRCARGRMERFVHPRLSASVYVDYAHTPQALEEVLREGRRLARIQGGRLCCVFGCGGERDRDKRSEMGRIAGNLADTIVITDDNPRGEDAASIRAAIIRPLRDEGHDKEIVFEEIGERRQAIEHAIAAMGAGDVVIVAGKGHEQGQLKDGTLTPFDDAAVVREQFQRLSRSEKT